jgi:3-deoxy-7-phosphoheptulonate synthase
MAYNTTPSAGSSNLTIAPATTAFPDAKSRTRPVVIRTGSKSVLIGGPDVVLIGGPCSIESPAQLQETASAVHDAGARVLRGGIFKMRTSPSAFQGLGKAALGFVRDTKLQLQMPLVSEVTDPRQIPDLAPFVDCFQVGARNMFNYELLKELGETRVPVLLKRGFAATIEEWLKASEYISKAGNDQIILCERGIRTFETATRNTLDLNAVAYLKAHTQFPVVVDPSHGTGRSELVAPMACAALAAGADAIMVEVHPRPSEALSDGFQALTPVEYRQLAQKLAKIAEAIGRGIHA